MPSVEKIKQTYAFILINGIYFTLASGLSIQSLLYPAEAEARGSTPSQYGFVFGIVQLSLFVSSLAFGKYGKFIAVEYLFVGGALLSGTTSALFAWLGYIDDLTTFIVISYALRFTEGIGTAITWCSGFVIAAQMFPNTTATASSLINAMYGFGFAVGPAMGTWLYGHGGFIVPFLTVGIVTIILSIGLAQNLFWSCHCSHDSTLSNTEELKKLLTSDFVIEETEEQDKSDTVSETESKIPTTFWTTISEPHIFLANMDLYVTSCGYGMVSAMLEPHLQSLGIGISDAAIAFLILGICYMASSFATGSLSDWLQSPSVFPILGNTVNAIFFTFIGPIPSMQISPRKDIVWSLMALYGAGYGCMYTSSLIRMHHACHHNGFIDAIGTISGLLMAADALGHFCGATVGGILVELIGFRAVTLIALVNIVAILIPDIIEAAESRNHSVKANS